jgi:CHASE2 domain-containing sensor protein
MERCSSQTWQIPYKPTQKLYAGTTGAQNMDIGPCTSHQNVVVLVEKLKLQATYKQILQLYWWKRMLTHQVLNLVIHCECTSILAKSKTSKTIARRFALTSICVTMLCGICYGYLVWLRVVRSICCLYVG